MHIGNASVVREARAINATAVARITVAVGIIIAFSIVAIIASVVAEPMVFFATIFIRYFVAVVGSETGRRCVSAVVAAAVASIDDATIANA